MAFDRLAFAARLRQERIRLGLTEQEAAAAAGRTVKTWRQYETFGCGRITGALMNFADKYSVSLDLLFVFDGVRHPKTARLVSETTVQPSRSIANLRIVSTRH